MPTAAPSVDIDAHRVGSDMPTTAPSVDIDAKIATAMRGLTVTRTRNRGMPNALAAQAALSTPLPVELWTLMLRQATASVWVRTPLRRRQRCPHLEGGRG